MREILFRGKRVDNGEWMQGDLLQNVDCLKIREQEKYIKHIAISLEVIPETVGQYTGLTDKNGNKIFGGDIVEEGCNGLIGAVVWDNTLCTYSLENFGEDYTIKDAHIEWEVIGNIHDNPELLKGGAE